jgi:hypothetical protein
MYLLQLEPDSNATPLILWLFIIAIGLLINFLLIKTAIKSAMKNYMETLTAYKLIELKNAGVTYQDVQSARKYIDMVKKLDNLGSYLEKDQKLIIKQVQDWWNKTKVVEKLEKTTAVNPN